MKSLLAVGIDFAAASGLAELVEYEFSTPYEVIDVLAELSVRGDTVVLSDVCIYPRNTGAVRPGRILAELLNEKRKLVRAIQELGWKQVEMTGERVAASSSANPGKSVRLIRKVDL